MIRKRILVHGVGINDVDYVTNVFEATGYVNGKLKQRRVWQCPDYRDWVSMLERCYSEQYKKKHHTYRDSHCVEEWLYLSKFKGWRATQGAVEGRQLDKDIIVPGNKLYSPDTCTYVLPMTNTFVTDCTASRGEYPIGTYWKSRDKKFQAQCRNPFTKKNEYLGYFLSPLAAHDAWRKRKHELAQLVAETESDPRVVEALKTRYSVEEWYKNSPITLY